MPGTTRTDLQRPGEEAVQTRLDFAPRAAFPMHPHPGDEIVYVQGSSLEYEVEGHPSQIIHAGRRAVYLCPAKKSAVSLRPMLPRM